MWANNLTWFLMRTDILFCLFCYSEFFCIMMMLGIGFACKWRCRLFCSFYEGSLVIIVVVCTILNWFKNNLIIWELISLNDTIDHIINLQDYSLSAFCNQIPPMFRFLNWFKVNHIKYGSFSLNYTIGNISSICRIIPYLYSVTKSLYLGSWIGLRKILSPVDYFP